MAVREVSAKGVLRRKSALNTSSQQTHKKVAALSQRQVIRFVTANERKVAAKLMSQSCCDKLFMAALPKSSLLSG